MDEICAASLAPPSLLLGRIAPDAIVCDAGYPENLSEGPLGGLDSRREERASPQGGGGTMGQKEGIRRGGC